MAVMSAASTLFYGKRKSIRDLAMSRKCEVIAIHIPVALSLPFCEIVSTRPGALDSAASVSAMKSASRKSCP